MIACRLLSLLLFLPWLLSSTPPVVQSASPCEFVLGFKAMHDLIPSVVGDCLDAETHVAANGDGLQHTTGGLLVWRKIDNWTAFTDGAHTWINGPSGLQERRNTERFGWEANPTGLPLVAAPLLRTETIGLSVQGRPITVTELGTGDRGVAFVGDTHGAPEQTTVSLIDTAIAYYRGHPGEVPASVTAYFIPTINPDGLAEGTRTNADGIDLNRNWQTSDWRSDAYGPDGLIRGAGGPAPFSEPESRELRDFLLLHHIQVSIFYHLPWGGIFGEPRSIAFAEQLAQASGYPFHAPGQGVPYLLTGTAHRWADEHGEMSVLLELRGGDGIEWLPNYRAMTVALHEGRTATP